MILTVFLLVLLGFIALGMPIAFALLLSAIAMMFQLDFFDTQILAQNMLSGANSFTLMAVPLFMLAGELMNAGGISRRIVNLASMFVGHIQGGLGYVAIFASVLLAALSGSAVADAAALGSLLIPMLREKGYDAGQASGLIAAGGIIAPIIPPSISIWDAAAPPQSQGFMLVGTLFILPFILGYTFWSYYVFRGKVPQDEGYH